MVTCIILKVKFSNLYIVCLYWLILIQKLYIHYIRDISMKIVSDIFIKEWIDSL